MDNLPNDCQYDADGQLAAGCDGAPWLAFDGANVSGVLLAGGKGWTFFHGPGLDAPLMGYYRPTTGLSRILYWVTDGAGRELAVADSAGLRQAGDQANDIGTWRYAGGIANSYTFASDRQGNANVPGLSFFRNRVYDQQTGRWLQEDPIGVAGGLNLYQFNGNNPVAYTDPFGLCPPKDSNPCGLRDVLTFTATIGGQIGASINTGPGNFGAVGHLQVGPVVGVKLAAGGAEPIETDNELSVGVGLTALNAEGGLKLDLLADQPVLFGEGVTKDLDPGHSSVQRDGHGGKTKISVQVGIGLSIGINWAAVADLAKQAKDKLTGADQ